MWLVAVCGRWRCVVGGGVWLVAVCGWWRCVVGGGGWLVVVVVSGSCGWWWLLLVVCGILKTDEFLFFQ